MDDLSAASGLSEEWTAGLLPAMAALVEANTGREAGQSTRLFGVGGGVTAANHSNGELVQRATISALEIAAAWPGVAAALPLARALRFWIADHPRIRQGEDAANGLRRALTSSPALPPGPDGVRFIDFVRLLGASGDLGDGEVAAVVAVLRPART